jgi:dienelactone hydrolase
MIKSSEIPYEVDGKKFTGFLYDGSNGKKAPGVLVVHEGGGMTGHPKERARMLAELGYVAFAADLFGERITSMEQAQATFRGLIADVPTWRKRALKGLDIVRTHAGVDPKRLAAIGFCFGGMTVLEVARSGADVACVVGFHPGLSVRAPQDSKNIKCKVLMCIGAVDPVIPVADRDGFMQEMEEAKVDWRLDIQGGVGHSFTNPEIDARNLPGFKYDARADKRAWRLMRDLFDETLGPVS